MEIKTFYVRFFKPAGDFGLALILLVLLAPAFIVISLLILLHNQPVLFRHTRPGLNGKLFKVYKFTSLPEGEEESSYAFGKILRRTSLDELPQLFNVLKGEMSFVGPRPLLVEYLKDYTPRQLERHLVKPGITGWAQVNGRNTVSFDRKIVLDLYYVRNVSFLLDLKILVKTLSQVLKWKQADFHDLKAIKPEVVVSKMG